MTGQEPNPIRLAVAGAAGRTGRCVVEKAMKDDRFTVVAALTATGGPQCGTTLGERGNEITISDTLNDTCDVLIDFTLPEGTETWLATCVRLGIAMVTGVTGLDERQAAIMHAAARTIPIVQASNFSVGIELLRRLVGQVAQTLGDDYDVEIVETHHRHKIDAPSGTAGAIIDEITRARRRSTDMELVYGREGPTGARRPGQIGVHALRMGDIVGQHQVHFSGNGETLTLSHAAHSRDTFAGGALRAATWLLGKPPGQYTMADVLA